jgi:hypothetical protein
MTKPRTTRDDETRDKELLEEWTFELINPFDLPPGVYREGFDFHWARRDVRGITDYRIEDLMRKGWKLVPANRAENMYIDPLSQNNYSKDFINRRDTILMERPSIYAKREKDAERKLIKDRTRALPGVEPDTATFSTRNSISSF